MDISVIVPIYGAEKYIERSLGSLFSQTKTKDVEFILVNDCTKDRSMEIARKIASNYPELNIIFIDKEVNGGVAAARQSGLDAATGTYTIHFDPDDWCEPEMLEELYKCAIENDSDIVICDFYTNFPNKQVYNKQSITKSCDLECAKMLLQDQLHGSLWNKLIRRVLFTENNISFTPGINLWEDKLIVTKLFCCTDKIAYLPKAYLHYMQNSESMVNAMSESSRLNLVSAIENMTMYFKEKGVYDELHEALNYSKAEIKIGALISANNRADQKAAAAIYPEATSTILKYNKYRLHWRISAYCATKGSLAVLNITKTAIATIKTVIGYRRAKF